MAAVYLDTSIVKALLEALIEGITGVTAIHPGEPTPEGSTCFVRSVRMAEMDFADRSSTEDTDRCTFRWLLEVGVTELIDDMVVDSLQVYEQITRVRQAVAMKQPRDAATTHQVHTADVTVRTQEPVEGLHGFILAEIEVRGRAARESGSSVTDR